MVVLEIVPGLATTAEKNDDYIESNEQLNRCVKFDVREDSTVGVKIAELLRLNVSTSIDEQFSLKVQKTAEVPRMQFIDKVMKFPVDMQRQVQHSKLCRKPWRFHRFSTNGASWTRLSTFPLWCSARCPWLRWCRKQVIMKKGRARA